MADGLRESLSAWADALAEALADAVTRDQAVGWQLRRLADAIEQSARRWLLVAVLVVSQRVSYAPATSWPRSDAPA
jgi:hypothetical protein